MQRCVQSSVLPQMDLNRGYRLSGSRAVLIECQACSAIALRKSKTLDLYASFAILHSCSCMTTYRFEAMVTGLRRATTVLGAPSLCHALQHAPAPKQLQLNSTCTAKEATSADGYDTRMASKPIHRTSLTRAKPRPYHENL